MAEPVGALRVELSADAAQFIENLRRADSAAKKSETTFGRVVDGIKKNWLGMTAAAYAAERALSQVWAMAKKGASFEESTDRLNSQLKAFGTNAAALVPELQALVGGQLSMQEATEKASQALAAGINPEQIKIMTRMSEVMGDLSGKDVAASFEELNMALVSGRDKALKAVGIFVDLDKEVASVAKAYGVQASAISDTEKFQIRLNAVMRAAPDFLAKYETAAASHADQLTAMEKKFDDIAMAASRFAKTLVVEVITAWKRTTDAQNAFFGVGTKAAPQEKLPGGGAPTGAKPKGFGQQPAGLPIAIVKSLNEKAAAASTKAWVDSELAREEAARDRLDADIEGTAARLEAEANVQAQLRDAELHNIMVHEANLAKKTASDIDAAMQGEEAARDSMDAQLGIHTELVESWATGTRDTGGFWGQQMASMKDAASFAFGQIQFQFSSTMANMILNGGTFADFTKQMAMTVLTTIIQMLTTMAVAWATTDATIVASTTATAGATTTIWAGAAAAISGFFAAVGGAFVALSTTLVTVISAVAAWIMGVLSAIAEAIASTGFGIPIAIAIVAGIAAIIIALAAPQVFGMAKGGSGIVTEPTLFLAGEAGPESYNFTPLGSAQGRHGAGGSLTVPLYLRGREIARAVVPDLWDAIQRQTGAPMKA